MLKTLARKGLHLMDDIAVAIAARAHEQGGALVTVLFHSICRDAGGRADPALAPNQNATVEDFRSFVGGMLDSGYTAVSPAEVDAGLAGGRNYLMITFDDGYFNNTLALGVLERFQAPATFFISSNHVLRNKAFWWDAYSRELAKTGASQRARQAQIRKLKTWTHDKIEDHLALRFGDSALRPRSDLDRPFTPRELQDFARSRWVHLGNHTCDHAILTNYPAGEAQRQVQGCQQALQQLVGYAPVAIAYPNGNCSQAVIDASVAAGLRVGLTVLPHRNRMPLSGRSRMALGRFIFQGGEDARAQCRKFTAGFVPSHIVKTAMGGFAARS